MIASRAVLLSIRDEINETVTMGGSIEGVEDDERVTKEYVFTKELMNRGWSRKTNKTGYGK